MPIDIQIDFDIQQLSREMDLTEGQIKVGATLAADELLTFIEFAQIKRYTSNSMPAKPSGSTYQRTFELRESSRVIGPDWHGDTLTGSWTADADYAEFVIGPKNRQARIHRGRWRSEEEIALRATQKAPELFDSNIQRKTK